MKILFAVLLLLVGTNVLAVDTYVEKIDTTIVGDTIIDGQHFQRLKIDTTFKEYSYLTVGKTVTRWKEADLIKWLNEAYIRSTQELKPQEFIDSLIYQPPVKDKKKK